MYIAVITADIIKSTENPAWKDFLLPQLEHLGKTPTDWNIYRGDGLQIRIQNPEECLHTALLLKSAIKQHKATDIRIAMGIGTESQKTATVTLNTGKAYENSGRLLEEISQDLEIKTPWDELNTGLNASLAMLNALCEQWTTGIATSVNHRLNHPNLNQNELAQQLNTTQSNVSRILSRAHWNEIQQYLIYFKSFIKSKL